MRVLFIPHHSGMEMFADDWASDRRLPDLSVPEYCDCTNQPVIYGDYTQSKESECQQTGTYTSLPQERMHCNQLGRQKIECQMTRSCGMFHL